MSYSNAELEAMVVDEMNRYTKRFLSSERHMEARRFLEARGFAIANTKMITWAEDQDSGEEIAYYFMGDGTYWEMVLSDFYGEEPQVVTSFEKVVDIEKLTDDLRRGPVSIVEVLGFQG